MRPTTQRPFPQFLESIPQLVSAITTINDNAVQRWTDGSDAFQQGWRAVPVLQPGQMHDHAHGHDRSYRLGCGARGLSNMGAVMGSTYKRPITNTHAHRIRLATDLFPWGSRKRVEPPTQRDIPRIKNLRPDMTGSA